MEKPKVFASPINKKINNSQEVFYEGYQNKIERTYNSKNVLKQIDDIFNSPNHVYKSRVVIRTRESDILCDIVGKTSESILTLDGQTIRISDISDIKKI